MNVVGLIVSVLGVALTFDHLFISSSRHDRGTAGFFFAVSLYGVVSNASALS